MGIFSAQSVVSEEVELQDKNAYLESCIYDEVSMLPQERREEFLRSDACKSLEEAGILKNKTIVRLSKTDDLERRISMAAIQLSKESNDQLFEKLTKNRIKERELLDRINQKYANKATKVAKMGQKEYLKNKLPIAFMRK